MAMGNGMMLIARAASILEAFAPTHSSIFFLEERRYHKIQSFEMTRSSRHFLCFCALMSPVSFPSCSRDVYKNMLLMRNSDISNGLGVDLSDLQSAEVDMFLKVKSNIPLELFTSCSIRFFNERTKISV
jgi:hypothetical protein